MSIVRELDRTRACFPCMHGDHNACRHHPEGQRFSAAGSEKGKPCDCEASGHTLGAGTCASWISGDRGDGRRCDKPSKGIWSEERSRFASGKGETYAVELCGVHLAARRKRKANDEARAVQWEADSLARQHRKESVERCNETIEKIRPLLAELGVHPATVVIGEAFDDTDRVGVLIPAELAELLTAKAIELEQVM